MNTRSQNHQGSASWRNLADNRWLLIALPLLLLLFTPARAAAALRIQITGQKSVSFPDANPATTPTIPASQDVRWKVKADRSSTPWTLTIIADDDLISGGASIPASAITWVGFPAVYTRDGRLSTTTETVVAQGTARGNTHGSLRFYLDNSWAYEVGNYSTTATLTVCSP